MSGLSSQENKRLKIAMVLRHFSAVGGLELYALKLTEGLLEDGHQISVICQKDESGLSHPGLSVHVFNPPPKNFRKAERLDYYFGVTSKLVASLAPFDIVHSHHFPVAPVDVVTFHNHTASRLSQVGYGWERALNNLKMAFAPAYQCRHKYDGLLSRQAKMRIFVGAVMKDDFYGSFAIPDSAPFAVAHPGASLEAAKAGAIESAPGQDGSTELSEREPFTFLFVGKGFRKKGLDTLLAACRLLQAKGHKFVLKIAGIRQSPSGEIQSRFYNLPVQYLGFRKDMDNVYQSSQAIILPSKIEPFGMAPVQGMQFGLVPIVSRVCGVAEVLKDGQDSLILQNHLDAGELAALMERLIVDRELYKRLSNQAKSAADKINWRQTVDATEKAYETVMQSKAPI